MQGKDKDKTAKDKRKDNKEEYEKPSLTKYSRMRRVTAVGGASLTIGS